MTPSSAAPGPGLMPTLSPFERLLVGPRTRALMAEIEDALARVDIRLADELRFSDPVADAAGRYLYDAGGKRVRPLLAILTSHLGDGATDKVIAGATALELTHLGSLYHDDVMDDADVRRGVPSAQVKWNNNMAILAGDLLFSRASRLMAEYGPDAIALQTATFERLVLGQMHETLGVGDGADPVAYYLQVLADKTGSLIAAAARVGVTFSDAPTEYETPVAEYGEKVGVAFQLLDDVIDLSPDSGATGKLAGTDLRAGVVTMPYLLLARYPDDNSRELRNQIDQLWADRAADSAAFDDVVLRLQEHPATEETVKLARAWAEDAIAALAPLPEGAVREGLTRFARSVVDRRG